MSGTDRAVFKIFIKGTVEAVWREITRTDEPQGAMFNMRMHTPGLKAGNPLQMRTANGKYTGMVGEVVEWDPPRVFAHTLKFTQYDDPPALIRYELKPVEGGVEFTLTADNVPRGTKTSKDLTRGGDMIVKTLKAIVETGRPAFGTRMLYGMFKLMEPFTPKKIRSENWPMANKGS